MFAYFSPQQSFININNADTSSIKIIATMTSFPPSTTTGTPQQIQPKRESTMAMAMAMAIAS